LGLGFRGSPKSSQTHKQARNESHGIRIQAGERRKYASGRHKNTVARLQVASYLCTMAHDAHSSHDHHEAEQNEIGGPVVFALILFGLVVAIIGFLAA